MFYEATDLIETGDTGPEAKTKLNAIFTLAQAEFDRIGAAKANLAATTAPGVTDDSAAGYGVGSVWIDTTADIAYKCLDATEGAAVWQRTSLAAILLSIIALSGNGLIARTGAGTAAARTLTGPAAGITVTNGDGAAGNPAIALANDLAAVEGLSGTGGVERTGDDAWGTYTLTAAGKALLDDATAADQRATLELSGGADNSAAGVPTAVTVAKGIVTAITKTTPVADGTYTVGKGTTTDGTITIANGIITAVQQAS